MSPGAGGMRERQTNREIKPSGQRRPWREQQPREQMEQGMRSWRQGLGMVPVTSSTPSPCPSSWTWLVCATGEGRRERRSPPSFHNKPLCDVMDWIIGDLRGHLRSNQAQLLSGGLFARIDKCCCSAGPLNALQELEFVNRNKSEGKTRPTNRISAFLRTRTPRRALCCCCEVRAPRLAIELCWSYSLSWTCSHRSDASPQVALVSCG
jgi:hypothetical protein